MTSGAGKPPFLDCPISHARKAERHKGDEEGFLWRQFHTYGSTLLEFLGHRRAMSRSSDKKKLHGMAATLLTFFCENLHFL